MAPLLTMVMLLLAVPNPINGNGRLLEPPSRSSMWRYGFATPINYNDNTLNCGGFYLQWFVNDGKCGVCGDPWSQETPRKNEAGGLYGNGIITRTYTEGQVIDVVVEVTANHYGWFEFRLCPHNDPSTPVTQDCLDQHLLQFADDSGTRYYIGTDTDTEFINMKLTLPAGVICTQCVFQWKWHAGNNYGFESNIGCVGCGQEQEEFYGCSDIAITAPNDASLTSHHSTDPFLYHPSQHQINSFITPVLTSPEPSPLFSLSLQPHEMTYPITCHAINAWAGVSLLDKYCLEQCSVGNCPSSFCSCSNSFPASSSESYPPMSLFSTLKTTPVPCGTPVCTSHHVRCHAVNSWQGVERLDLWCNENCLAGRCPPEFCQCVNTDLSSESTTSTTTESTTSDSVIPTTTVHLQQCHAVGQWAGQPQLDHWCSEICSRYECDPQICICDVPDSSTNPPEMTCYAINGWSGVPLLDEWCTTSCNTGLCPQEYCACGSLSTSPTIYVSLTSSSSIQPSNVSATGTIPADCHAVNAWTGVDQLDQWCRQECALGNCPPAFCFCKP